MAERAQTSIRSLVPAQHAPRTPPGPQILLWTTALKHAGKRARACRKIRAVARFRRAAPGQRLH